MMSDYMASVLMTRVLPLHSSRELFRDRYVCVGWDKNESFAKPLTLDAYMKFAHIATRFSSQAKGTVDGWTFQQTGQSRQTVLTAGTYNLMPQLVVGTKYIATMHRRLAEFYGKQLDIRILEPELGLPDVVKKLQWHRFRKTDHRITWMRRLICTMSKELAR